ncbi:hypothetical protein [Citromicrobium bathyomarinum]|uniref:hypothetical protein n=1 Tax=Citromicrobium bathyomarinum TaxID=72174 RepID=UPI00315B0B05
MRMYHVAILLTLSTLAAQPISAQPTAEDICLTHYYEPQLRLNACTQFLTDKSISKILRIQALNSRAYVRIKLSQDAVSVRRTLADYDEAFGIAATFAEQKYRDKARLMVLRERVSTNRLLGNDSAADADRAEIDALNAKLKAG